MTDTLERRDEGFFYPPHAQPLNGDEGFIYSTWKFLRNPIEGFGPMAYNQPIVSVPNFGKKLHVITDPEGMMQVLALEAKKFTKTAIDARILGPATKEGLLSVHGDQWKRQRRAVAPMFAKRHMADLAPMITEVLNGFKAKLDKEPKLDLNAGMAELTFDVLAKALLGDPKGLDGERLKYATRNAVTSAGTLRPDDLVPWPRWVPRPISPKGSRALKKLKSAADDLLDSRDVNNPGDDLVGLLISAIDPKTGQELSRRERRDNLIGFFIAGHETTALTLTWALYLVGMHAPTAERIRAEVIEVCGQGDIAYDDIDKLTFTRAVIDETMRLYPPAPMLNRECHEETEIHGRKIEIGDTFLLANYVMHRTERLWENPNAFDPDRFIRQPELKAKGAPYMPFGAGPRICVGMAFAVMEAVMALGTLVRDYDIEIPADCYPRPLMTVTLRPEGGVPARMVRVS
ncbi:cytochrome P450 [Hellea balneolensis]|uniref:cytochrome P450 n=1 Tax=Hellea balneolensis TaxID=287478 RepID=UPI00047EA2A0|nr:cytochrome P450 [Hellea balneolensis]